jgi:hypothetical protein
VVESFRSQSLPEGCFCSWVLAVLHSASRQIRRRGVRAGFDPFLLHFFFPVCLLRSLYSTPHSVRYLRRYWITVNNSSKNRYCCLRLGFRSPVVCWVDSNVLGKDIVCIWKLPALWLWRWRQSVPPNCTVLLHDPKYRKLHACKTLYLITTVTGYVLLWLVMFCCDWLCSAMTG